VRWSAACTARPTFAGSPGTDSRSSRLALTSASAVPKRSIRSFRRAGPTPGRLSKMESTAARPRRLRWKPSANRWASSRARWSSWRPAERRSLVEEAAGLGRFKLRRHRAELKLARVAIEVERARDVEAEVKKRLRPLALQATAAERAQKLAVEIARLRARIAQLDLAGLDQRLAELETMPDVQRTLGGSPMSSASTSWSTSTIRPRPACRRP